MAAGHQCAKRPGLGPEPEPQQSLTPKTIASFGHHRNAAEIAERALGLVAVRNCSATRISETLSFHADDFGSFPIYRDIDLGHFE